jgi:hypothetical protein
MNKQNLLSTPQRYIVIDMIKDELKWYPDEMVSENDTRNAVYNTIGKTLKDYWSGNTKDIHSMYFAAYKWMSTDLVDENIVKTHPFKLIDDKKFVGLDHDALAKDVINKLCDLYLATPDVYIPHSRYEEKSSFKSLFKIFK